MAASGRHKPVAPAEVVLQPSTRQTAQSNSRSQSLTRGDVHRLEFADAAVQTLYRERLRSDCSSHHVEITQRLHSRKQPRSRKKNELSM